MRTNEEIIEIIKTTLNENDMSLSELARRVGMAKSAVSRYLNGSREFPLNRANDFANALHISTEYLLGFEKRHNDETETVEDDNSKVKEVDTIAAHFDKEDLTEDEKKEVQDFINYLKSKRN